MKVLMINVCCGMGSTGRICTDIAELLIERGHECKIAYGRDDVPEKYRNIAVKIGSDLGVYRNALKSRLFDNEGFNAKCATERFLKWVKEYDPDVIHLHNLHGYYLNVEILFGYLKTCNKKIVWTLHDCWSFTGHCSYFDYPHCDKWKMGCGGCIRLHDYPKSVTDHSKRNYKKKKELFTGIPNLTIVTPSQWLADLVRQSTLKEYPVEVINNGIDHSVFKPTPSNFREKNGLKEKKILLGIASVWDKRKGFDDFLKLSGLIDDDYRIVMVGVNQKQKKRLPNNIIGIERTNNTMELAEIYTAADLFVNPTREEVLGMVNIEANACGTPVITYKTGGSPECINIKSGRVVERDDINALLNGIEEICKNNLFTNDACVEQAMLFDKNKRFQEYIDLYETLS